MTQSIDEPTNDIELDARKILNDLHFTNLMGTHASDDYHVDEALQALNKHYLGVFLELVGEDEAVDMSWKLDNDVVKVKLAYGNDRKNELRTQLRAAAHKRLGGSE